MKYDQTLKHALLVKSNQIDKERQISQPHAI